MHVYIVHRYPINNAVEHILKHLTHLVYFRLRNFIPEIQSTETDTVPLSFEVPMKSAQTD